MAEAGSFADRVKQQADVVRVIGEYVRLKKTGQNFTGLCPFHSEKTPSFAVHPVKQIYHCFGCGAGGDVFKFVMEMDKCDFPEAVRTVAAKCGIALPSPHERSPEERREQQQRTHLVELHREAAAFFNRQLEGTLEGKAARAYLADRGLDADSLVRFGLGYTPSAGDALVRHLKGRYSEKLLEISGLAGRDPNGRFYDRFRRRIMFPISSESGKVIAFGGRAMGDDLPKYLNSPETPIYTKSSVLYHLDRAKESIRQADAVILVEGYMDAIAVARAGIGNVIASCGTSLTESQVKLLSRFTRRVVVNFDPDTAGQAATERSLAIFLEQNCEVRVVVLPGRQDPDSFLRAHGGEAYRQVLQAAPSYLDYLIDRARQLGIATAEEKLRAINFLMPHVQRIPNALLRSEWASLIAAKLRVDEPALREALRRSAAERHGAVKTHPALSGPAARLAERRLVRMLADAPELRDFLAEEIRREELHRGLETEKIVTALLEAAVAGAQPDLPALSQSLEDRDRRLLFEIAFENFPEGTREEAESCLEALRRQKVVAPRAETLSAAVTVEAQDAILLNYSKNRKKKEAVLAERELAELERQIGERGRFAANSIEMDQLLKRRDWLREHLATLAS